MFESMVLRRSETGEPVTAGQLAEALLYYQNVHLIIDMGTLRSLIHSLGIARLLFLLQRPGFSAVHCEESLGTHTQTYGALKAHSYIAFSFAGHDTVGQLKTRAERVQYDIQQAGISSRAASKYAQAFIDKVPARKLSGDQFIKGGIAAAAKNDLLDTSFTNIAIARAVASTPGGYQVGPDLKFDVIDSDLGVYVFTDIDFESINRRRASLRPPVEPLTVAHLLTHILDARADLALASFYGGDFYTSTMTSEILQVRHAELLNRSQLNVDARQQFSKVVLPDCPSLAEVIDSGERTFDEFLLLLDKSARFKTWLKSVSPDESLIRTYLHDVTTEGWIQRLPAKTMRYLFTIALDTLHPVAGVAAGVMDTFILEKLLGGWRPNHFINNRLSPFIGE
jgi:hypothetical protein